jgi:hypothetical protein
MVTIQGCRSVFGTTLEKDALVQSKVLEKKYFKISHEDFINLFLFILYFFLAQAITTNLYYFSPCSVSFVLRGEYIQYSPLINFRLIIPSIIHLQCLCSTKNEKKQHNEGNMALRIISILTH